MDKRETHVKTLRKIIPKVRPQNIQDLWNEEIQLDHQFADLLFDWTTEEEIENLLKDEQELTKIAFDLYVNLASLGIRCQEIPLLSDEMVLVSPCMGCSSPCDAGFSSCSNHKLIKTDDNPLLHKIIL